MFDFLLAAFIGVVLLFLYENRSGRNATRRGDSYYGDVRSTTNDRS
jgi:hypothetical protein